MNRLSRRQFHQSVAAALTAPVVLSAPLRGADAPSEKITLGFIGVGTMGRGHLHSFLRQADVRVVAVSDVVAERRDAANNGTVDEYYGKNKKRTDPGCHAVNDFRDLLKRNDLDAVVIATPDHWHAIPGVLAQAKKHVYCEKPLTHAIAHGRKIVEAVKKTGVTFQTGSQRSEFGGQFRLAAELGPQRPAGQDQDDPHRRRRAGSALRPQGRGAARGHRLGPVARPCAERAYSSVLCPKGIHGHFPAWRNYREYAGGGLADMGAHHFDIAQWALGMDDSGPVKIEPPEKGGSGLKFTYASGVVMIHGGPSGCTFEGSEGTLYVDRGQLRATRQASWPHRSATGGAALPRHRPARNWLECIRSGKATICPAEVGHRTSTVCQLGNIGYWLR